MSVANIPPHLQIALEGVTDRGLVREENQDSILHMDTPLGALLLVADGMGGYQGGGVASKIVVEEFSRVLAATDPDRQAPQAIRDACASANTRIRMEALLPGSPYRQMGSTVVLALIQRHGSEHVAWIAHIGDSRAYLVRKGALTALTIDHSAVQALISRNLLTPEEARHHPQASTLTRCLGHQAEVEIDIDQVALQTGDTLLLCSDGLWGFADEQDVLATAADASAPLSRIAQSLLLLAMEKGGQDNVGIELARLTVAPKPQRSLWRRFFGGRNT